MHSCKKAWKKQRPLRLEGMAVCRVAWEICLGLPFLAGYN